MKILITGGAGFIGSALVRHIIECTNYSIVNLDCLTYAGNIDSLGEAYLDPRHKHIKVDICDALKINEIFQEHQPDRVMHLAAESHVDRSIDTPSSFIKTNVIGTCSLLDASKVYFDDLKGNKKRKFCFHHISTDEVYGDLEDTNKLFTENTPYAPSSPYSASKASSDHMVRAWGRTFNLPVVISNCSNNYGPYHFPEKLIPHVILNAIHGKPIPLYGNGLQIRDWLYVEDHVNALMKIIESDSVIGETYNIGGNSEKTNLEVVNLICDILEELRPEKPSGVKAYKDLIAFVKDRPGHDVRYAIDATKIENDLGWTPSESFETGLRKTIQWYLENSSWWKRVLSGEYKLERQG